MSPRFDHPWNLLKRLWRHPAEGRRRAVARWSRYRSALALEKLEDRTLLAGNLAVSRVVPLGPAGHPFDTMEFQFNAAVQTGSFTVDKLALTGPGGPITPHGLTRVAPDKYDLDSTGLTGLDTYGLVIGPNIVDTNGQPMPSPYQGTLFSAGVTIGATNTTYENRRLVIDGNTATIDGAHTFAGVEVLAGATLTHSAATTTTSSQLAMTLSGALWIDGASKIDVTGRGYLAGYTVGNTTVGAATVRAGGGYGGSGADGYGGSSNAAYGDYRNPNDLGSGGGPDFGGGSGGGLVRITAGTAQVDGAIVANGGGASRAAGSGGGIRLDVGTLAGAGVIAADGGSGQVEGGSGGGGRVAVYYTTLAGFDPNRVTARTSTTGAGPGAVGTVYLKQMGGVGELRLDSRGMQVGVWTPLGQASDTAFVVDKLVIAGPGVVAAPQHQMPIQANNVSLLAGAVLTHQPTTASQAYSLLLTITGALTIDAASKIDVTGRGYLAGYTVGNTTTGAATVRAGGAYGGLGAPGYGGVTNAAYGDYRNPNDLGSGGGPDFGGGSGGGLVRITAGTAQVDGAIVANGGGASRAAGSGGGIRLDIATLAGAGVISANGGGGQVEGGSGGGGRVAVYYTSAAGFDLTHVTALAGTSGDPGAGAVGTVYLKQMGGVGELRLDSHGMRMGGWTPLGQASDTAFVADKLILAGPGVVAAPQHQMPIQANNVSLLAGAVLTHQPTSASQAYSLLLTVAGALTIDKDSRIDVAGRGYLAGYTVGNTTTGAATVRAGGAYGGLGVGAYNNGSTNAVYGDYRNPNDLGSGGGPDFGGGSGGGLVRISAATMQIDGAIVANGSGASRAAGSGGGIRLDVATLAGTGVISANGGGGQVEGGSGGGGRVAVYYTSAAGFDLTHVTALAGTSGDPGAGAVGTVYLKQMGGVGELRLDSHGMRMGVWTPLGQASDTAFVADKLILAGPGVVAAPQHQMPIQANNVSLLAGAVLTHQPTSASQAYSLLLTVAGALTIDAASKIDVSSRGYLMGYTVGNTTTGAATVRSGGTYGGLGADGYGGVTNAVYGDYRNPNDLGSGGGPDFNAGGSGGGLVRISAATAQVDGAIVASGGDGQRAAGSGGGIRLDVGTLAGGGVISANGGGGAVEGGSGGGGRVAVYYTALNGFDTARIRAHPGAGGGGTGAVGTVFLKPAGGIEELRIDSHGQPAGVWTPLGAHTDTSIAVTRLVISGAGVVAAPEHQMPIQAAQLLLQSGAVLTHQVTTDTQEYSLKITVTDTLTIDAMSRIDVSGRGYLLGHTLGNTTVVAATSRAGGGYGGLGADGYGGSSNAVYGDARDPNELGSGGGPDFNVGGSGGGLVRITALNAQIDGAILANGAGGNRGAGSGGGILLNVGTLSGTGTITADGGAGAVEGGSGGGGRVAIYAWNRMTLPAANVTARGGTGGGGPGQIGTKLISATPFFNLELADATVVHDIRRLSWIALGVDPSNLKVDVLVARAGQVSAIAATPIDSTSVDWNTRTLADGLYELRVTFRDAMSRVIGEATRTVLINNSVHWHSGLIDADQTWLADRVNVLDGDVVVKSGVHLTIQPGAIVKADLGKRIVISDGASLIAQGTMQAPIIFTSLRDDSAGGDTNQDGNLSYPEPGDWGGFTVQGSGQLNLNAFTDVRYAVVSHAGTITVSTTWLGTYAHHVTGNVIVPNGVTLTIQPGAVVKFDHLTGITVQNGGRLIAQGTVALPINFTSIRDDAVGGHINPEPNPPAPAAGDWSGIIVDGSQLVLDHTVLSYSSGSISSDGAAIRTLNNATVTFSNSILRLGFWDGIQTFGGTVTVSNSILTGITRAINTFPGSQVHVVNSTFDDNGTGLLWHGGTMDVVNSLVTNSISFGINYCCGSPTPTIRYTDVWHNAVNFSGTPNVIGTNGNISADPKYKNAGAGDYRLNYLSPAIDAADGTVAPASDFIGAPRYTDPRSPHTGKATSTGAYPDMGAFEFVETADSDIDLVVVAVNGPSQITEGQSVTVTWTVRNLGTGTLQGSWHDAIGLVSDGASPDAVLTVDEALSSATLGPGQSVTFTKTVVVPGTTEGLYRWQVHTNSRGEIFEGKNSNNNIGTAANPSQLLLPELTIGGSVTGQFTTAGQLLYYKVRPQAGQDVIFTLNRADTTSWTQLYLSTGHAPTTQDFLVQSAEFNRPNATLPLNSPLPQVYYLLVVPRTLPSGAVPFTLSANTVSYSLTSIGLDRGAHAGSVTIPLRGTQLRPDIQASLIGSDGKAHAAQSTFFTNSALVYATFDLTGLALGTYDVQVVQQGMLRTLPQAFKVVAGSAGQLQTAIQLPERFRVGRPFTGTIVYRNTGDTDIPAPILILSTNHQAGLRLRDSDSFNTGDLQVLGASFDGPAGILRPGQEYSIPFSAIVSSNTTVVFALSYQTADATNLVNWAALEGQIRPSYYTNAQWNPIWASFKAIAGTTWGGYVRLLAQEATVVGQRGGLFYSVTEVLMDTVTDIDHQLNASASGHLYLNDATHPLGGATVLVSSANGSQAGSVLTLANGSFALTGLPAGTYQLSVPGYLLATSIQLNIPASGSLSGLVVTVSLGGVLSGTIRSQSDGTFLSGIQVRAVNGSTSYTTQTGNDGTYSLTGLPAGSYNLTIGGDPWETKYLNNVAVTLGTVTSGLDFALSRGAAVHGQVRRGSDNSAVAGAVVAFTDVNGVTVTTRTDTSGVYTLKGLSAGHYTLGVFAAGFAPIQGAVDLTSGMDMAAPTLFLGTGANLTVTITDSQGAPVVHAAVSVRLNGQLIAQLFTDVNGKVHLDNLAAGTYQVTIATDKFWDQVEMVNIPGGGSVTRTYALHPAGTIHGVVTDGHGMPIPNLGVNILGQDVLGNPFADQTITGADGSYRWVHLPAGTFAVTIGNGAGIDRQDTTINATNFQRTLNFQLVGAGIHGTVFLANGKTVLARAQVALVQNGEVVALATTDLKGVYRFRGLSAGSYVVVAASSQGMTPPLNLTVPADGDVGANPLSVGSFTLTGTAVDAAGHPVGAAPVSLIPAIAPGFGAFSLAVTAPDGSFTLQGLPSGSFTLLIQAAGRPPLRQAITLLGSVNQRFVVSQGGRVTGRISFAGQGVKQVTIEFLDPTTHLVTATGVSDVNGRYTVAGLPNGTYNVIVLHPDYQAQEVVGIQVNSDPFSLDVRLQSKTTSLGGVVRDSSGHAVTGAEITISNNLGEIVLSTGTGLDGSYTIDHLLPGTYALQVSMVGFQSARAPTVVVQAGTPVVQNFTLLTAGTDDYDYETVPETVGLLPQLVGAIRDYLDEHNPAPERSPNDIPADIPIPRCPDCVQLYERASATRRNKEAAYQRWQANHDSYNTTIFYSALELGLQMLNLIGSIAQVVKGPAFLAQFQQLSGAAQFGFVNLQILQIGISVKCSLDDFLSTAQSSGLKMDNLLALASDILGGAGNTKGLLDLGLAADNALLPEGPVARFFGSANVISNLISLGRSLKRVVDEFNHQANTVSDARDNYLNLVPQENALRRALSDCEAHCPCTSLGNCPNPPNPDNPTPGPHHPVPPGTSFDPNEKDTIGFGTGGYVAPGTSLTYTIRFENKASASLAAQVVTITDILDPNLDWSTLLLASLSFNGVTVAVPPGLTQFQTMTHVASDPNPVRVQVTFDPATGTLTWIIESIDPVTGAVPQDPLAGFLPPNDASHRGEGFVTFIIVPRAGLATGTTIRNRARIVFDVNAPIDTQDAVNTIDAGVPTSTVAALPATTATRSFTVSWSGTDVPGGSGIAFFDIFVSVDGGAFTPFLLGTTQTSATFTGDFGHTYGFYSVATDNVGHRQATPPLAQAITRLAAVTATSFAVSPPAQPITAGTAFTLTVRALRADGQVATDFTGTVHFRSTNALDSLPLDYTFTAADQGVHTFTLTLLRPGSRTITVTADALTGSTGVTVVSLALENVFVIGLDNQVYAHKFDANGHPAGGYFLTQPGVVKSLTVAHTPDGNPELFVLGLDNQVYAQQFDANGNSASSYFLVQPGLVKAVIVGYMANGNPELFVIGLDDQVYAEKLDANGNPVGSYFLVQAGHIKQLVVAQDAANDPELFVRGLDNQVYAQKLDAAGNAAGGYFLTQRGQVKDLSVTPDAANHPELFVIGLDNQVYGQKFDAAGNSAGGYFLTQPGLVKALSASHDAAGDPELFVLGLDNQVYAQKLDDAGSPAGGYFLTQPGQVKSLDTVFDVAGDPELFVIGLDNQVYGHRFDALGSSLGDYFLLERGAVKAIRTVT